MYPNMEAEMARAQITGKELADELGMSLGTFSAKRNGKVVKDRKNCFSLDDAAAIKRALHSKLPLEALFEWKD